MSPFKFSWPPWSNGARESGTEMNGANNAKDDKLGLTLEDLLDERKFWKIYSSFDTTSGIGQGRNVRSELRILSPTEMLFKFINDLIGRKTAGHENDGKVEEGFWHHFLNRSTLVSQYSYF
jgi:hypothetical protein